MNTRAMTTLIGLILLFTISVAAAQEYPEASLDQATYDTLCSLTIERYAGLDGEGMQAEYQWSLDMATLCLQDPDAVPDQAHVWKYAIEFQRHAGRTGRYRGFGEQAVQDYERAIEYASSMEDLFPPDSDGPEDWEVIVFRDIADTYVLIGAYEPAQQINELIQQIQFDRQRALGEKPSGLPVELRRAAEIAERRGRVAEAVDLQQHAVRAGEQRGIPRWLATIPEVGPVDPDRAWTKIIRHADVRRALSRGNPKPNDQREIYCYLARTLRLNGQLDEAVYALKTAELTPWQTVDLYRKNLNLYVDREWAFLALARGEAEEAVGRGNDCLSKYAASISPPERVELLDLVSRGLEQTGDLQGAFDRLKEAIKIVEGRRANLALDEHKQMYIGQYAGLHRRACELVIRINTMIQSPTLGKDGAPDAESRKPLSAFDRRTAAESFEWAERAKARAMLDSMRRLGRRMAKASASGETREMTLTRELAGDVIGTDRLRKAPWMGERVALVEYMLSPRGAWVWVVRRDAVDLVRLDATPTEIEKTANALRESLLPSAPRNNAWRKPATWLHDALIRPIDARIAKASHLVIVGDGALREIPFETFIDRKRNADEQLLIQRKTIAYAPSATVLNHTSSMPRQKAWNHDYWGFASTRFHSSKSKIPAAKQDDPVAMVLRATRSLDDLAPLPNAGEEVERAAERFPKGRSETFIDYLEAGQSAKHKLLAASASGELRGVRHLHFATHALLDSNRPFDSGLVLSPPYVDTVAKAESRKSKAESRKCGTGFQPVSRTFDSRLSRRASILSLHEIGDLKLGCELVVLSSCQAIGAAPVDGDWLNGLTRAFLVAGSRSVICTLWDVSDTDAGGITPQIYRAIRSPQPQSPADALRTVKLSLLRSPTYGHPSHWACFVCYGGLESPGR